MDVKETLTPGIKTLKKPRFLENIRNVKNVE